MMNFSERAAISCEHNCDRDDNPKSLLIHTFFPVYHLPLVFCVLCREDNPIMHFNNVKYTSKNAPFIFFFVIIYKHFYMYLSVVLLAQQHANTKLVCLSQLRFIISNQLRPENFFQQSSVFCGLHMRSAACMMAPYCLCRLFPFCHLLGFISARMLPLKTTAYGGSMKEGSSLHFGTEPRCECFVPATDSLAHVRNPKPSA